MWLIEIIKKLVCKKELEELNRWRNEWSDHRAWFAEHREILMVLDNIQNNVTTTDHKWVGDIFYEIDKCLSSKTISAFAIVKNAKGDLWKGHYKTDPKLGVTQEMVDACQFSVDYQFISIEKAIQSLETVDSMYPERNYEICPIYNN